MPSAEQSNMEVNGYVEYDEAGDVIWEGNLCSACAENRDNAHEPVEFEVFGDDGDECEECDEKNTVMTEDDYDAAVSDMVEMLQGGMTSVAMGSWEDRSDRYSTEVIGQLELPESFSADIEIGGWVEIDEDRETITCLLGMKMGDMSIGECEGFQGEYDKEHGWGRIEWGSY